MSKSQSWDLGFCGLNCGCCSLRTEQRCNGYHSPINGIHWSPDCPFIPCAARHHVKYCFECEEFPCTILLSFAADGQSHHCIAIENLKDMKHEGLNAWKTRWKTPSFCPGWTEEYSIDSISKVEFSILNKRRERNK